VHGIHSTFAAMMYTRIEMRRNNLAQKTKKKGGARKTKSNCSSFSRRQARFEDEGEREAGVETEGYRSHTTHALTFEIGQKKKLHTKPWVGGSTWVETGWLNPVLNSPSQT
jgi:hypothetical protein